MTEPGNALHSLEPYAMHALRIGHESIELLAAGSIDTVDRFVVGASRQAWDGAERA